MSGHGKKSSGLAITSLVLGILGLFCCGFFTGLGAIICGHMARGKVKKNPYRYSGDGMALAGLILGYLSIFSSFILAALIVPGITGAMQAKQAAHTLIDGRQIVLAMQKMAANGPGFPADVGIRTTAELRERLVKGGYAKEEELNEWNFEDFKVGNVSKEDPAETILLYLPMERPRVFGVVFTKGGDGRILRPSRPALGPEAPRDPAFLAP